MTNNKSTTNDTRNIETKAEHKNSAQFDCLTVTAKLLIITNVINRK